MLREELTMDHVKKKIVGHWGTVPGQNFVWTHCNRVIKRYDLDMIYISGPGHGGNFQIANTYIDGTYSEIYPNISQDIEGMKKMFKQFSFPCGVPSHCAPETPGFCVRLDMQLNPCCERANGLNSKQAQWNSDTPCANNINNHNDSV